MAVDLRADSKTYGKWYGVTLSAEGNTLADGTVLILSDKDQKWMGLKDTFKF